MLAGRRGRREPALCVRQVTTLFGRRCGALARLSAALAARPWCHTVGVSRSIVPVRGLVALCAVSCLSPHGRAPVDRPTRARWDAPAGSCCVPARFGPPCRGVFASTLPRRGLVLTGFLAYFMAERSTSRGALPRWSLFSRCPVQAISVALAPRWPPVRACRHDGGGTHLPSNVRLRGRVRPHFPTAVGAAARRTTRVHMTYRPASTRDGLFDPSERTVAAAVTTPPSPTKQNKHNEPSRKKNRPTARPDPRRGPASNSRAALCARCGAPGASGRYTRAAVALGPSPAVGSGVGSSTGSPLPATEPLEAPLIVCPAHRGTCSADCAEPLPAWIGGGRDIH